MRILLTTLLLIGLTAPSLAQRRGGGGFRGPSRVGPSRGMVGGGFGFRGPGFRGPGFRVAPRAPAWGLRGGWGRVGGLGYGYGGGWGYWPGWWGGGFVSGFSTPAYYSDPWPAVYPVYSYAPAPAAPPVIIINQTPPSYEPRYIEREPRYVEPSDREIEPPAGEPYRPITYEIAFKDGRQLTALAYWVRETTLHYVTRDFEIRQAPLASVDRARSRELNRPNGIGLRLPPER